jgi:hypothetical protein
MSERNGHHWAQVRAHAAEGGIYATCLAELCDHVNEENKSTATCIIDLRRSVQLLVDALVNAGERLNALEARPEAQVLPTTPQEGGPTVVVPIQVQQGVEPAGGLVERVADALDGGTESQARGAVQAVADWLESQKVGCALAAARWLREEVERG